MCNPYVCVKCGAKLEDHEAYEYRYVVACEDHIDEVIEDRDRERNEIMQEEERKLAPLKGLDISGDNVIGKANRELMARHIEVSSKESQRLHNHERGNE